MSEADAINLLRDSIIITLKLSAPILIVALVVGLVVSIIQTTTSIQEQTLTFVPKVVSIFATIVIFSAWAIQSLLDYTREIFSMIQRF